MQPHSTLAVPRHPLSPKRLALALTGFTITGRPEQPFCGSAVLDPAKGSVPAGPYTITDAAGKVLHTTEQVPHWCAERWAVRHWRLQCDQATDGLTPAQVREQLMLRADIRALEAQAAALECRIKAIDAAAGADDLWHLDRALEAYGEAVQAHRSAVFAIDEHDDAQREAA